MNDMVNVVYDVNGDTLRAGYAYPLFAALCSAQDLHGRPDVWIAPISDMQSNGGVLRITDASTLTIRAPREAIDFASAYAGEYSVGDHRISLSSPRIEELAPSNCLYVELVTFGFCQSGTSGYTPERWAETVAGLVSFAPNAEAQAGRRRKVSLGDRWTMGHSLQLSNLTPEQSLHIQCSGIGGRKHFGCGVPVPGLLPESLL